MLQIGRQGQEARNFPCRPFAPAPLGCIGAGLLSGGSTGTTLPNMTEKKKSKPGEPKPHNTRAWLIGGLLIAAVGILGPIIATQIEGHQRSVMATDTVRSTETKEARLTALAPTATITPLPHPVDAPVVAPCDIVGNYHDLLNNGEYAEAWLLMTPLYQSNPSHGSYAGWEGYWKLTTVSLLEVVPKLEGKAEATCLVRLRFVESSEERAFTYFLTREDVGDAWLLNGVGAAS